MPPNHDTAKIIVANRRVSGLAGPSAKPSPSGAKYQTNAQTSAISVVNIKKKGNHSRATLSLSIFLVRLLVRAQRYEVYRIKEDPGDAFELPGEVTGRRHERGGQALAPLAPCTPYGTSTPSGTPILPSLSWAGLSPRQMIHGPDASQDGPCNQDSQNPNA